MEDDDIHPVIRLLAARKKSHPEEFAITMKENWTVPQYNGSNRWARELDTLGRYMTEAERKLMYPDHRELVFNVIQGCVMRKLLEGPNYE